MAFKIKEGLIIDTTTVFDGSGVLQVPAPEWITARTVTFAGGDVTGSFTIKGNADVEDIELTLVGATPPGGTAPTLEQDLRGDVYADNSSTKVLENSAAGVGAWFMGDLRATDGTTTVLTVGDGTATPEFEGNANTADAWSTSRNVAFAGGDITGDFDIDGSGDVTNVALTIGDGVVENAMLVNDHFTLSTDGTGADFDIQLGDTWNFNQGTGINVTIGSDTVTIAGADATTTSKGVAQFSSDNFAVASGVVTIKDGGIANAELVNDSITIGTDEVALGSAAITDLNGLTSVDVDDITIDGNAISSTNANGDIVLDPNGTGAIDVSNAQIKNLAGPTVNSDAATKEYVDTVASASLHYHDPVRVEAETNLDATYDNGTAGVGATLTANNNEVLVIDGVTVVLNDRVLVYNQTTPAHNGVYSVTQLGVAGTTPWVLTRTTDTDSYAPSDPDALGLGDAFFVLEGDAGAGELYVMTTEGSITFGTTAITFSQIGSAQVYKAGDALTLTDTTFDVNVDDSTIEVSGGNALQVKDLGITNAKLANDHYTVATDGTGADFDIQLGDTWNFNQGTGISVTLSADTITIENTDLGSDQNTLASVVVDDTDTGYTWSETGTANASNGSSLTFVSGTGIDVDIDTASLAVRVENTDGGSNQDIIKSIVVDDTDVGYTWSETGTYTVSGNTDSLTFVSGDGTDFDVDTSSGAIKVDNTDKGSSQNIFKNIAVSGQDTVVADTNDDTLTFVAGDGISITTNATNGSVTVNSTSGVTSNTTNVTTTNPTVVDTFSATTFRSAKVFVQVEQDTDFQVSEIMVIHDGTVAYHTEYAIVESNGELAEITTQISGGNVEVLVTLNSATTAADVTTKKILIDAA